ncbi:MAG TPA: hypothetical protein VJ908_04385 [Wenzhouxiangellaceae bacterium]|nr:hypothetical protein [Wenzhouxiangellaceae bacterium]
MTTVGIAGDPNLDAVQSAFAALGDLSSAVVLVGGCATGLLVTSARSEMIRPTLDVDLVLEVVTQKDYRRTEQALRARGFTNDQSREAPICRWRFEEVIVDLMPMTPEVLGFGNRWYPRAVALAEKVLLPDGQSLRLISAPVFLVTKFEAFRDRGRSDFLWSHDLEDVMTVIDGRAELEREIAAAPEDIQGAIREQLTELLADPRLLEATAGFLPGDAASQARLSDLYARLERMAT